jgi:C1A family cysteine protease
LSHLKTTILKSLVLAFVLSSTAHARVNVAAVQKKIEAAGAEWQAQENRFTQMNPDEIKSLLGLRKVPNTDVLFTAFRAPQNLRAQPPVSLDWRSMNGKNYISPILDQGNCGSCVAFASIGTLESQFNISSLLPFRGLRLSPQNLFSCGGGGCETGWMPEMAAQYLQNTGVVDEACAPYLAGATGIDQQCGACADADRRTYKIASYSTPTTGTIDMTALKQALQKGPLVTTLTVYADFLSYSSGIYKHVTGDVLGGHAVSLVGFDDVHRAFILRNSWGTGWGEQGFFRVSYDDESGIALETWHFDLPAIQGAVSLQKPNDRDFVSGAATFQVTTTYSHFQSLQLQVKDSSGKLQWSKDCGVQKQCSAAFPSTQFVDGEYTVQGVLMNSGTQPADESDPHYFYIANKTPQLKVDLQPDSSAGTDLSKPVTGRIQFVIDSQSSTVPLSSVTFHYKGPGGVSGSKEAHTVTQPMTLGWRTNPVPNGEYEVWLTGHLDTNEKQNHVDSEHLKLTVQN